MFDSLLSVHTFDFKKMEALKLKETSRLCVYGKKKKWQVQYKTDQEVKAEGGNNLKCTRIWTQSNSHQDNWCQIWG